MQKTILVTTAFLLITLTGIGANAQSTDKKENEKNKTTTVDAWRNALPQSETTEAPPVVVMEESKDNVEAAEDEAQIEKRILELEQRLMEALKQRDSAALKNLLADDFMLAGVNIPGSQPDKTRFIEWAQKKLELKSYNVQKTTVRVYPTTAVVTTNYKRQASIAGSPTDGDFIVTDVWVKRGKRWQAVSHHISRLEKP
jgi:ketosteroid isomerase-like protein